MPEFLRQKGKGLTKIFVYGIWYTKIYKIIPSRSAQLPSPNF